MNHRAFIGYRFCLLTLLIFAAVRPLALAGCLPAPPGLIGWWQGERNAYDAAGATNGIINGGLTFASGMVGQAFSFNGANAEIEIGPFSPEQFSLSLWVKPAASQQRWSNIIDDYGTCHSGHIPTFDIW